MLDDERQNPFENFIGSDSFDLSQLDQPLLARPDEFAIEIQDFLDNLPQPLNYELWDNALDERQKLICAYLTTELVDRVMRVHHPDEVHRLSDEELIQILTVPITIAMLAEDRLHRAKSAVVEEIPTPNDTYEADMRYNPDLPANWTEIFQNIVHGIKHFFRKLFQRAGIK